MHYYPIGKRFLDLLLCLLALPLALPLMGLIALVSAAVFRHPVLYTHLRPGYRGRPFLFYKFSTLMPEEEREGRWLSEGERQTRWGKFLRDYSLDELPQLFNILRGDMSWVGPRPLLMEYLPLYAPQERRRHWVKPGLTGLAQVAGRNELDWNEKMHFDQAYVAHISFGLDVSILARTFATVLGGQKVNFGIRPLEVSALKNKPENGAALSSENVF